MSRQKANQWCWSLQILHHINRAVDFSSHYGCGTATSPTDTYEFQVHHNNTQKSQKKASRVRLIVLGVTDLSVPISLRLNEDEGYQTNSCCNNTAPVVYHRYRHT